MTTEHHRFMQAALSLARRNLGQTWPNPSVGALIIKNGHVIATGYTARGGRPHAETQALEQAGVGARGATLYVTLEPCSHHGKTPPCADAIIAAGIACIVIACGDPNPQVAGEGIKKLKAAGIEVITGICEKEAREINRGFFSVMGKKRPYIALKIATSLDGKMAFPGNNPRWITGEYARAYGHLLRARYDAIATGIGTVLADNPELTCRLPGLEDRAPQRILFDRKGRLPKDSKLAKGDVWVMKSRLEDSVHELAEKGITRLLIEAGPTLSNAFLQSNLVDRIYWFRAPIMIGNGGLGAISDGLAGGWNRIDSIALAADTLEIYER